MAVGADPAEEQLGLDGAGAVDDDDPAVVVAGDRGVPGGLGGRAAPGAEGALQEGGQVDAGEVADDHDGAGRGVHVGVVEGLDGGAVDRLDGVGGAGAGPGEPVGGVEEFGVEGLGGAPGGVGLLVDDLVQAVGDPALDLGLGEGGGAQGVGEQGEAALEPGGRDLQGDPDARVVGVGVQGGAGALQLAGELLGGEGVGALVERAGEDRGDAVQAFGFGGERGVEEDLDGDELLAGPVAVQDGDAVAESGALGGGEGPGLGVPGCGWGWKVMAGT